MISPVENRTMFASVHKKLRFAPFELSSRERVLRRGNEVLPLGSRALDILIYLAERPGQVIGKKELIDNVWPDVIVERLTNSAHLHPEGSLLHDDVRPNIVDEFLLSAYPADTISEVDQNVRSAAAEGTYFVATSQDPFPA